MMTDNCTNVMHDNDNGGDGDNDADDCTDVMHHTRGCCTGS